MQSGEGFWLELALIVLYEYRFSHNRKLYHLITPILVEDIIEVFWGTGGPAFCLDVHRGQCCNQPPDVALSLCLSKAWILKQRSRGQIKAILIEMVLRGIQSEGYYAHLL